MQMYVGAKLAIGERQVYAVCKANTTFILYIYIIISNLSPADV